MVVTNAGVPKARGTRYYRHCEIKQEKPFVCVGAYDYFLSRRDLALVKNPGGIKAFGQHLRVIREARGLSLKELGDLANVDKSTLYRIEVGIASPNLDLLISVARALQMQMHELMHHAAITALDNGMN